MAAPRRRETPTAEPDSPFRRGREPLSHIPGYPFFDRISPADFARRHRAVPRLVESADEPALPRTDEDLRKAG